MRQNLLRITFYVLLPHPPLLIILPNNQDNIGLRWAWWRIFTGLRFDIARLNAEQLGQALARLGVAGVVDDRGVLIDSRGLAGIVQREAFADQVVANPPGDASNRRAIDHLDAPGIGRIGASPPARHQRGQIALVPINVGAIL